MVEFSRVVEQCGLCYATSFIDSDHEFGFSLSGEFPLQLNNPVESHGHDGLGWLPFHVILQGKDGCSDRLTSIVVESELPGNSVSEVLSMLSHIDILEENALCFLETRVDFRRACAAVV